MQDDLIERLWRWSDFGYGVEASATMADAAKRIAALEADNARLMETLQFYAREQSWRSMGMHMCGHSPDSTAVIDGGKRARATLAKIKEVVDTVKE